MGNGCSTLAQHDSCAPPTYQHNGHAITAATADNAWAVDTRLECTSVARSPHVEGGGLLRSQSTRRRCRGAPRHRMPVPHSFETIVQGSHTMSNHMQGPHGQFSISTHFVRLTSVPTVGRNEVEQIGPTMARTHRHSVVQAIDLAHSCWHDNSDPLGQAAATHGSEAEQSIGSSPWSLFSGRGAEESLVGSPTRSQANNGGSVYTFQLACFEELVE
jgi:hypothetical protein